MKIKNSDFLAGFVVMFLCYIVINSLPAFAARDFNTTRSNRDRSMFTIKGDLNYCKTTQETDYVYKPQKADCSVISKDTTINERQNWLCKYDPEFCAFFRIPPILD